VEQFSDVKSVFKYMVDGNLVPTFLIYEESTYDNPVS